MPVSPITPRLQLRRVFLRAAIASLALGGVIAVAALLLNSFNETTSRILGTLAALAFHCGIAIAILHNMDKGRALSMMRVALALFSLSFAVLVVAIWALRDRAIGQAIGSTAFLTAAYIFAVPGANVLDRRAAPALGWAAVGLPAFAFLLALVALWANGADEMMLRAAFTAGVLAFTAAQFALLFLMRATEVLRWLYLAALAAASLVAMGIGVLIWAPELLEGEAPVRVLGAIGVVDAVSTLVLIVMVRLRGTPGAAAVVGQVRTIRVRCPRCAQDQELDLGGAACCACGLRITVAIEATNCATCGYTLENLPGRVCPECGTPF